LLVLRCNGCSQEVVHLVVAYELRLLSYRRKTLIEGEVPSLSAKAAKGSVTGKSLAVLR
jgi:hypothetical protein